MKDRSERIDPRDFLRGLERIVLHQSHEGWIFRGEPACYPQISSGLYRSVAERVDVAHVHMTMGELERSLVEKAKQFSGLHEYSQILADIQHRGGRTNHIDFTKDLLIAAYFACQNDPERDGEDGRIIMLAAGRLEQSNESWRPKIERSIQAPIGRADRQKSVLVSFDSGYAPPRIGHHLVVITIPAENKRVLLDYLDSCMDISEETLFLDTMGYIRNQDEYIHNHIWLGEARSKFERGDYTGAIEATSRYLRMRYPDYDDENIREAYRIRGACFYNQGQKNSAFQDWFRRELKLPDQLQDEILQWAKENGRYDEATGISTLVDIGMTDGRRLPWNLDRFTRRKVKIKVSVLSESDDLFVHLVTDGGWNYCAPNKGDYSIHSKGGVEVRGSCVWISVWGDGINYQTTTAIPLEVGVQQIETIQKGGGALLEVEIEDDPEAATTNSG